uniref:Uncharacterized protein n=1 Tax=Panagrolaimus sp. JU765 TaxID=591449 RepID=A0AC34QSM6_9BILA
MSEYVQPRSLNETAVDIFSKTYVDRLVNSSTLIDPETHTEIWTNFPLLSYFTSDAVFKSLKRQTNGCRQPIKASILIPFSISNNTFLSEIDLSGIALTGNLLAKILVAHQNTLRSFKAWNIENSHLDMFSTCQFLKSRNASFPFMEDFSVNQILLLTTPKYKPRPFTKEFSFAVFSAPRAAANGASPEEASIDNFSRVLTNEIVESVPHHATFPGSRPEMKHFLSFMPNLKRITIQRNYDIETVYPEHIEHPDEFLDNVVGNAPKLTEFHITCWPKLISARHLTLLSRTLTRLSMRDQKGLEGIVDVIGSCHQLVYLDISHDIRDSYEFATPNQSLFRVVKNLKKLEYLDISGTNLHMTSNSDDKIDEALFLKHKRQKSDILALCALHKPLNYLGLYGCGTAGEYRNLPAKHIFSNCNEEQLLMSLEIYQDRQPILYHALNEIYMICRHNTICNFPMETLRMLIFIMEKYHKDNQILTAGTAAIFYLIQRIDLTDDYRRGVTRVLFTILKDMYKDQSIVRNVCLTLCQYEFSFDVLSSYTDLMEKLIECVTLHTTDRFTHQVIVFVMNSLAGFLSSEDREKIGEIGAVSCMMSRIKKCCEDIVNDRVMEACWSFLWNITDESPGNCGKFLEKDGIQLISEVYAMFPNETEVIRNMIGMLGNVSEIEKYREPIIRSLVPLLFQLLTPSPNQMDVTYNVAAVLANLLSEGREEWSRIDCQVKYREIYNKLIVVVKQWSVVENRLTNYHTLKPIIKLMECQICYASQLWATWAIYYLLSIERDKYSRLFMRDDGIRVFGFVRGEYHRTATIHKYLDQIQNRISEYCEERYVLPPNWRKLNTTGLKIKFPIEEICEKECCKMTYKIFSDDEETTSDSEHTLTIENLYITDSDNESESS